MTGEERVDGGDAVDGGGDRLLHRDPCAFLAGAGGAGAAPEAGGPRELAQQRLSLGLDDVEATGRGPRLGLCQFLVQG